MITKGLTWGVIGLMVVAGWLAVLAGIMLSPRAAPAAFVIGPTDAILRALPEGTAVVSHNALGLTVSNDAPGLARALYRAGAVLVLPAGLTGCAPETKPT